MYLMNKNYGEEHVLNFGKLNWKVLDLDVVKN